MRQVSSLGNDVTIFIEEDGEYGTIAVYPSYGDYETIGKLEYQISDTKILIKNVEVLEEYRGRGIGSQLYNVLLINHIDKEIDWGIMTSYGEALKSRVESE